MNFPCGHDRPTPPCRHCALSPSRPPSEQEQVDQVFRAKERALRPPYPSPSSRRHFLRFLGAGAVAAVAGPIVAPVMIQVPSNYVRFGGDVWTYKGVSDDGVVAMEFSYNVESAYWLAT